MFVRISISNAVALSLALEMSRFVQEEYLDVDDDDDRRARRQQRRLGEEGDELEDELELLAGGDELEELLPGGDPVLEEYWDQFEELRAAFHSVSRMLTLVLLCAAKLRQANKADALWKFNA